MIITIADPLREPMIHRDFPGGPEDLQEYMMEVLEGIKDHLVRDQRDPGDTRWEYTYHQRLFRYAVPTLAPFDQIETLCRKLAETPYTRRAQAITWKVWEDNDCYDPACLQSVWCRITEENGSPVLSMNVRFRSNDAYKAAFMNIFALVEMQRRIAARVSELSGRKVEVGRYCHMADSYHLYGSYFREFEARFLGADGQTHLRAAHPALCGPARIDGRSPPGNSGKSANHGPVRKSKAGYFHLTYLLDPEAPFIVVQRTGQGPAFRSTRNDDIARA